MARAGSAAEATETEAGTRAEGRAAPTAQAMPEGRRVVAVVVVVRVSIRHTRRRIQPCWRTCRPRIRCGLGTMTCTLLAPRATRAMLAATAVWAAP
eukprot:6526486-Prymnesium_polylepis.1